MRIFESCTPVHFTKGLRAYWRQKTRPELIEVSTFIGIAIPALFVLCQALYTVGWAVLSLLGPFEPFTLSSHGGAIVIALSDLPWFAFSANFGAGLFVVAVGGSVSVAAVLLVFWIQDVCKLGAEENSRG